MNQLATTAGAEFAVTERTRDLIVRGARDAIKRWAAEAGIEGFISGHSLRVVPAVSLVQASAIVVDMQTARRWKNPEMPAECAKAETGRGGEIQIWQIIPFRLNDSAYEALKYIVHLYRRRGILPRRLCAETKLLVPLRVNSLT